MLAYRTGLVAVNLLTNTILLFEEFDANIVNQTSISLRVTGFYPNFVHLCCRQRRSERKI